MKTDVDPYAVVTCSDCHWRGFAHELRTIKNFNLRVRAGEICPAGECPRCHELAYLLDKNRQNFMIGKKKLVLEVDFETGQLSITAP